MGVLRRFVPEFYFNAEAFEPVKIDLPSVKSALNMYQRHKKISMSRLHGTIPEN